DDRLPLLPVLEGERHRPIGFQSPRSGRLPTTNTSSPGLLAYWTLSRAGTALVGGWIAAGPCSTAFHCCAAGTGDAGGGGPPRSLCFELPSSCRGVFTGASFCWSRRHGVRWRRRSARLSSHTAASLEQAFSLQLVHDVAVVRQHALFGLGFARVR